MRILDYLFVNLYEKTSHSKQDKARSLAHEGELRRQITDLTAELEQACAEITNFHARVGELKQQVLQQKSLRYADAVVQERQRRKRLVSKFREADYRSELHLKIANLQSRCNEGCRHVAVLENELKRCIIMNEELMGRISAGGDRPEEG
jgi:septal ring factor EnvC (AmiA/AmiB activator)